MESGLEHYYSQPGGGEEMSETRKTVTVTEPPGGTWRGQVTEVTASGAAVLVSEHGHTVYLPHAERLTVEPDNSEPCGECTAPAGEPCYPDCVSAHPDLNPREYED